MHGGTLTAMSDGENKGTTFVVRLPRMLGDVGVRRDPSVAASRDPKENVIP
jgi:hypothetical protein